jgi:5-methylcytosine-specific restriction protein A
MKVRFSLPSDHPGYERNPKARAACIAHHGCKCAVCGFDFATAYGPIGEGFIHVHHILAIGKIGKEYKVDPINHLIPVCPNCHAMIHRTDPALTIERLRKTLKEQK